MEKERVRTRVDNQEDDAIDAGMRKRLRQLRAVMLATGITLSGMAYREAQSSAQPPPKVNVASANVVHRPAEVATPMPNQSESEHNATSAVEPMGWLPEEVEQEWPLIEKYAIQNDIDPRFLAVVITEESLGQNLQNPSGASGPAQVMQSTADGLATYYKSDHQIDTTTVEGSIEAGALAMRYIKERHLDKLPIQPYSNEWIYLMTIGYGDGEPALLNYFAHGTLSQQAQNVAPIWINMWNERNHNTSVTLQNSRGIRLNDQ